MDVALDKVGLGLWQVPPILTLVLIQAFAAVGFINSVFINQPYKCTFESNSSVLFIEESTITKCNLNRLSISSDENVPYSQPYDTMYLMYYNKSIFLEVWYVESTIATDFSIHGDRVWLSPLYQMGFVIGVMLGDLGGTFSDTYGRVITIRLATLGCLIAQLVISFSPYLSVIIFCRILTGISYSLITGSAYNLTMETTPIKYRALVSTLIGLPYYISAILLGISAYFIRNWRLLHLCNSIYVVMLSVTVIFLKNSPHWLLQKGHIEKATEVIKLAYECNNKYLPPKDLCVYLKNTKILDDNTSKNEKKKIKLSETCTSLFKTTNMRIISIIHPIVFTLIGFIYYGIPLNANNFTDNPHFYVILIQTMEILPSLLGTLIVTKLGNINCITILSIIAGICMMLMIFLNYWIVDWILVVLTQMAVGLIFLVCWILSSELFPTSLRCTGFGISNFACHCGSLFASYIYDTVGRDFSMVPNLISAIFCFVAAFLVRFLPETCGEPLCENISDIEKRETKPFSLLCQTKKAIEPSIDCET